jgi:SH3 domain protein
LGILKMSLKSFGQAALALVFCFAAVLPAVAESVWVSDEFEVLLRTGPSTEHAIRLTMTSGTELEVLESDAESGYTRVRTLAGTEGWVLTRYLMPEAPARQQLERLTSQLTNANTRGTTLGSQLETIRTQYDEATRTIANLERSSAALQAELEEIKSTSANAISIDRQNKDLRQQLTDAEIKVSILQQENEELAGQKTRNWFLAGALVLFAGIILGIWLPRIRWQRRSRYERF